MNTRPFLVVCGLAICLAGCDSDSPTNPTPEPVDVTLMPVGTGSVRSDGIVSIDANAGDAASDHDLQAFLRFDLSGIPSGATIDALTVDFSSHTVVGDPYEWGCVEAYAVNVFPLQSSAYLGAAPSSDQRLFSWCDAAELASGALIGQRLMTAAQAAVGAALELRLQFAHKSAPASRTDADGEADQLQFATPTLMLTYTEPG